MKTLTLGLLVVCLSAAAAQEETPDTLGLQGPVVVFIYPAPISQDAKDGDSVQALHDLQVKLKPQLEARSIKVVSTRPVLLRLGEEDNPKKRIRQVDFRKTPAFLGTVLFAESHEAQVHQGLETEPQLRSRIDAYFAAAKKR
jgi:hypothetical protein